MYYKHGGVRQQRTEDQAFMSLHLQADQFHKSFNTHITFLSSWDLFLAVLLVVLAYIQHQ